jgi:Spy/CpxP family protein refolding chaperone
MKNLLLAILLASISFSCFAENTNGDQGSHERHGPKDPEKIVAHMTKTLSLSGEQAAQIQQILESRQAEAQAADEKIRELRKQTQTEIAAVLTDAQREQFKAMHQKRREERQKKRAEDSGLNTAQ